MSIIILYENQGEITKNGVIVKGNSTVTPLLKVSTMAGFTDWLTFRYILESVEHGIGNSSPSKCS